LDKNNYILMVFEGEREEKDIFDSLNKYFLIGKTNRIIYSFHCGEIYSLYHKLQNDEDETLFFILQEKLKLKNPKLLNIKKKEIEAIYLFFDYDSHASGAEYNKLQSMVDFFDDEFDNGKLFVSYPMAEGLRHLKDEVDFKETIAKSEREYKNISKECNTCFLNFNNYTQENWNTLISQHCSKANFIINDTFEFPQNIIKQISILSKQKVKYIDIKNKVAVVSAFPLMLLDYYGVEKLKRKIVFCPQFKIADGILSV